MDPKALLDATAAAYRGLSSLSVDLVLIRDSGHDGDRHRHERRARAWFQAPDRVRVEGASAAGDVLVSDGETLHNYFGMMKRYGKSPLHPAFAPGCFNPEFPHVPEQVFLFGRIAERVNNARLLREEVHDGVRCHVLEVTYAESPAPVPVEVAPIVYWLDAATHLVRRVECRIVHCDPFGRRQPSTHIASFANAVVNAAIGSATFTYTPPEDAETFPHGGGAFGAGGGSSSFGGAGSRRDSGDAPYENRHSGGWSDGVFQERVSYRFDGRSFSIERRLFLSEDRAHLRIEERLTGPQGTTTRDLSIPAA